MKKLVILFCLMVGTAYASAPYSVSVSTASKVIVPKMPVTSSTTWSASTAMTQGSVVKVGNVPYFVISAGTSGSTAPTVTTAVVTDGTATVVAIPRGNCNGILFSIKSEGSVDFAFGDYDATEGTGLRLVGEGHMFGLSTTSDNFKDAISARSTSGTVTVGVQIY